MSFIDRDADLAVLRALLAADLRDDGQEREAFEEMNEFLGANLRASLSTKQRAWARDRAEQLELEWEPQKDPAERNKDVPRGAEVAPAWDVSKLPKRPPGRRVP